MASIIGRGERQWQARVRRKAVRAGAAFETKARAVAWGRQVEADVDAGRFQVAARVTEMVTRIKVALPSAFPYQAGFADLASRIAKLPP
jgi:hypothetical protein